MRQSGVVHQLVAHFLKENKYEKALEAFEQEHGKPIPIELPTDETLDEIVQDRIGFKQIDAHPEDKDDDFLLDHTLKRIAREQLTEWSAPYPARSQPIDLPSKELIISSAVVRMDDTNLLILSSVKSQIFVFDLSTKKLVFEESNLVGRVVIKKIEPVESNRLLFASMDGKLHYYRIDREEKGISFTNISHLQVHKKLISDARSIRIGSHVYVVSLGWDFVLKVNYIDSSTGSFSPVAEYKLQSQGSCFDVLDFQGSLVIILGKNENTLLDVLRLDGDQLRLLYRISLNDAEFTSSSFSPRLIAVQPSPLGTVPLVAVATSHEPYMRVIVVTLKELASMLNQPRTETGQESSPVGQSEPGNVAHGPPTSVLQSPVKRSQIIRNINTMSPQDKYSQPLIAWRLPGTDTTGAGPAAESPEPRDVRSSILPQTSSGLWVAGEDGSLRGIDLRSSSVAISLESHKDKIKSIAQCYINRKECLLTCGNDYYVNLWH